MSRLLRAYTVEEIDAEVARTGASKSADDITEKCRTALVGPWVYFPRGRASFALE